MQRSIAAEDETAAPRVAAEAAHASVTGRSEPRRVDSRRLLEGAAEIVIDHGGAAYRLRLTRNDKLILTK